MLQTFTIKCSLVGSTLPVVTGLIFKCKNENKNSPETTQLSALDSSHDGRKASLNWIVAMQKVQKTVSTNYAHLVESRGRVSYFPWRAFKSHPLPAIQIANVDCVFFFYLGSKDLV